MPVTTRYFGRLLSGKNSWGGATFFPPHHWPAASPRAPTRKRLLSGPLNSHSGELNYPCDCDAQFSHPQTRTTWPVASPWFEPAGAAQPNRCHGRARSLCPLPIDVAMAARHATMTRVTRTPNRSNPLILKENARWQNHSRRFTETVRMGMVVRSP